MSEQELGFDELMERIGSLIEEMQAEGEERHKVAFELLDLLEVYHREALMRLATAIPSDALVAAREDPMVAHLLDTYLGEDEADPVPLVEEALEEIRPYVHSHGGEMELLEVDDGVVTLNLLGSCNGCPSSTATLTQGVERTLRERWVGFKELRVANVEKPAAAPKLLQIQSLKRT